MGNLMNIMGKNLRTLRKHFGHNMFKYTIDCFIRVYCDKANVVYVLLQIQHQCRAGLSAADLIMQGAAFTHSIGKADQLLTISSKFLRMKM